MEQGWQQTEAEIRGQVLKAVGLMTLLLALSLRLDWVLGYLLGSLISLLMFRLLALSIDEAVTMQIKGAQSSVFKKYLIRYLILGVVLYTALQVDHLNFLATVIGLFMVKLTIVTTTLYREARDYLDNLVN
ncbi:MAG: ATP synthase subunit I [Bacillota bacterium]